MCQPLGERHVTIVGAATSLTYPARCLFVGAMNRCLCGHAGVPIKARTCSEAQITR